MEQDSQTSKSPRQTTRKIVGLSLIVASLIIISSYFLPWLGMGISGQPHSVFSVSAFAINKLKETDFAKNVADNFHKRYAVDTIYWGRRIDDKNAIRIAFSSLVDEKTIKIIQSHLKQIEETKAKISDNYLSRDEKFEEIIKLYMDAESKELVKAFKDFIKVCEVINKIGEQNIITKKISKLEGAKEFLKEHSPESVTKAEEDLKETRDRLQFFYELGLENIVRNKTSMAEVIEKYLSAAPEDKISTQDKEKIIAANDETNDFFALLSEVGEKNIFENKVTIQEALVLFASKLEPTLAGELTSINNRLKIIVDKIEQVGFLPIVAEEVSKESIIEEIKAQCQKELNLTEEDLKKAEESARRIIDTILLFKEKEVADKTQNHLMLKNRFFASENLWQTESSQELHEKIKSFISYYKRLNNTTKEDFVNDTLRDFVKTKIINTSVQEKTQGMNQEIARLTKMFNQIQNLGEENLINAKFSPKTEEEIFLIEAVQKSVTQTVQADFKFFLSLFETIETFGPAKDLSGEKISGLIVDRLTSARTGRFRKVILDTIADCQEKSLPCAPNSVLTDTAKSLLTDSDIARKTKELFLLPENAEELKKIFFEQEIKVFSKIIDTPLKTRIEDITDKNAQKQGFARLIIEILSDQKFRNKLDKKIRDISKRFPVKYAVQNAIIKLYMNCAVTALTAEITQNPNFINKLLSATDRLKKDPELTKDELAKLTTAKLRQYKRALSYVKTSCQNDICDIYFKPTNALGIIQKDNQERLNKLLIPDKDGLVAASNLSRSFRSITELIHESLVGLTYGTQDLKKAWLIPLFGILLLIISIAVLFAPRNIISLVFIISGLCAFVIAFWLAIKMPSFSNQTLLNLGTGFLALFLGLIMVIIFAVFHIPKTTRKTQMILLGGIIVLLGFFLPWTGANPDSLLNWRSGYNITISNFKLPELSNIPTSLAFIFPALAVLLMLLTLLSKKSGAAIFLLAFLSLILFCRFVFWLPQMELFWGASGLLAVTSGFSVILISTAVKA